MSVLIPQRVLETVFAHAAAEAPRECCGLLVGEGTRIVRAEPTRNVHASETRYLIDPRDHFTAIRRARTEGLDVIGAYHSHPASPPYPSATDAAEALAGGFLYVIVRPGPDPVSGEARVFRFDAAGNVEQLSLVPVS